MRQLKQLLQILHLPQELILVLPIGLQVALVLDRGAEILQPEEQIHAIDKIA